MKKHKRLTRRVAHYPIINCHEDCECYDKCDVEKDYCEIPMLKRLAELEDDIESGKLVYKEQL